MRELKSHRASSKLLCSDLIHVCMYVRRFKEKGLADVELIAKRVAEVSIAFLGGSVLNWSP